MNPPSQLMRGGRAVVALLTAACMFWVVATLVFWVLGIAPSSPNWNVFLALSAVLFIAGATAGSQQLDPIAALSRRRATASSTLSGGLIGFYSAATISSDHPGWTATGTALLAAGAGAIANRAHQTSTSPSDGATLVRIAVLSFASVSGYGAAFLAAAWTMFAADARRWMLTVGLALVTVVALAQPVRTIKRLLYEIRLNHPSR